MRDATVRSEWRELASATVSDALDRVGVAGQAWGIAPLDRTFRAVGPAYTVRMLPVSASGGTVGDYLDDVPAGAIIVIDNGGRTDCTVWGDLLTTVAARRGIAGTVIDGMCRDSSRALALRYPLFTRGVYMRTGKDRVRAVAYDVPVSVAHVAVEPGDLVVGDADGVVIVPREVEDDVLAAALEVARREEAIRADIEAGQRLDEARARHRYHGLQRVEDA